jgi:transcriptional regulator with XRE-family HTH domain
MARAAHASGVRDLALAAQISPDTVARFERGEKLRQDTIRAIQRALEAAGCEFIIEDECGGTGMRLRKHVRIGG